MASSRLLLLGLCVSLPVFAQEAAPAPPAPPPPPPVAPPAVSDGLVVIVHPGVKLDDATPAKVRKFYLNMAPAFPGGVKVESVDLKDGSGIRPLFLEKVLGMSAEELDRHWIERQYQTANAVPDRLTSDAEVIAWVAKHEGGIGFVHASAIPAGTTQVKVIMTVEK